MPDVKISQLPAGTANANAVVPATNAAGTTTEKVTLGAIRDLAHAHSGADITSGTVAAARLGTHASTHQTGGADAILPVIVTPASLSANQNDYAPGAADIIRLSSSTAVDITGLAAPSADGALRLLTNTNAAANRFRSVTTANVVLLPDGGSVTLTYSTAISRWRIL